MYVPIEQPLDINFACETIRGWPKQVLEVWGVDYNGRNILCGYGVSSQPFQSGNHKYDVPCWRPAPHYHDSWISVYPELEFKDVLISNQNRQSLRTESTGKVSIEIDVITRDFGLHGVKLGQSTIIDNKA